MKKQIMILIFAILFVCLGLCGCTQNKSDKDLRDEENIIGTWINHTLVGQDIKTVIYVFSSNRTYEISGKYQDIEQKTNGTWEISDNKLIFSRAGESQICEYEYSNNYKTLTITDPRNHTMIITKQ